MNCQYCGQLIYGAGHSYYGIQQLPYQGGQQYGQVDMRGDHALLHDILTQLARIEAKLNSLPHIDRGIK